jgi:hypothetical protein
VTVWSPAKLAGIATALSIVIACGNDRGGDGSDALVGETASAAGDVSLDSATVGTVFHGVKYPLTSENYRKWIVAQAALDSIPEPTAMPRVDLRAPTDDDIDHTVDFLSNDDPARQAIERSGLSVKDFVLTSIALGQALNFAGDPLVPEANRTFVRSNREDLVRAREARQFHVLDDDDDDREVGDGRGGDNGRKLGHAKGKGHKHRHKHGHKG